MGLNISGGVTVVTFLIILILGCNNLVDQNPVYAQQSSQSKKVVTGSTIAEVEAANGKPFIIYGFEIDAYLAGTIMSWEGGALKGQSIQFNYTTFIPGITGDEGIRSDNPILTQAGVNVK
jgi:hypothetical protein